MTEDGKQTTCIVNKLLQTLNSYFNRKASEQQSQMEQQ